MPDFTKIEFLKNGTPYSPYFDDIYFSQDNGKKETEYVFLEGNNLLERWSDKNCQYFTIAETGFGTGLNLLCTLNLWETLPKNERPTIHFHSFEKYLLKSEDFSKVFQIFAQWNLKSSPISSNYQMIINGQSKIELLPLFYLTVYLGDINTELPQTTFMADAWFLDGFCPKKNPSMWSENNFSYIKERTNAKGTIATFTASTQIRRKLEKNGFVVTKRVGFGKKREMITATLGL